MALEPAVLLSLFRKGIDEEDIVKNILFSLKIREFVFLYALGLA